MFLGEGAGAALLLDTAGDFAGPVGANFGHDEGSGAGASDDEESGGKSAATGPGAEEIRNIRGMERDKKRPEKTKGERDIENKKQAMKVQELRFVLIGVRDPFHGDNNGEERGEEKGGPDGVPARAGIFGRGKRCWSE